MRWLIAVAVLALAAPAHASAQSGNRALIVLDGSLSMNKDAGNGGTRLDAAKQAVHGLLDRLPPNASLGLRVYGSQVNHSTRAKECADTHLVIPVGPLDKGQIGSTVDALDGKGMTPIGNSLLAAPQDLGSAAGRRSVVLISDGGDNCAPPDPCKAAAQVAKQGIDLSISVVGLQVDPRARRQLKCIAKAGGGSYVDVQDADKLGEELAAALARAFRSYDVTGTKVAGGDSAPQATALATGLYQDVITPYGRRFYAIDVPAGRRLLTSVTEVTSITTQGAAEFHTTLLDPQGNQVQFDSELIQGRDEVTGRAKTFSPRMAGAGGGTSPPGRYVLQVEIAKGTNTIDPNPIPLEIGVQLLKPGEDPGLVRGNGAIPVATPTPTPTATPKATATVVSTGGSGGGGGGVSAPLVLGVGLAGLLVGLAAAAVLGRRRPA